MENSASTFDQHIPSFVENSYPGASAGGATAEGQLNEIDQLGLAVWPVDFELTGELRKEEQKANESVEKAIIDEKGWTKSLASLPRFGNENIDDRLLKNPTMSLVGQAPKAFRSKKQGYKLWKEGYVRGVLVKPNVKGKQLLFLVKSKVCASMKNIEYNVYIHLDQHSGDVVYANCNCKAGQGGCCKHIAALLYTLLDYANMDFLEILPDLTCTQAGQKWHVPSGATSIPPKAFKFDDLTFEKIEEKKRKRSFVGESRESYCATPQFALQTSSEELQSLVERLRFAGKASLFCEAVESNQCQPCSFFQTSSAVAFLRGGQEGPWPLQKYFWPLHWPPTF